MSPVTMPRPSPRMSALDAGFLYLDRPSAPLHIGCLAVVDGDLRCHDLARLVEKRLTRLWRYRQRALAAPLGVAHPSWEDDPDFDVRDHVQAWTLPAPGGPRELAELAARLLDAPLDRERPLWEMHVLHGLDDGRTAVLQKVHHCMIDGASGVQLLEQLLDDEPSTDETWMLPPCPRPLPSRRALLTAALRHEATARTRRTLRGLTRTGGREALARLGAGVRAALRLAGADALALPWNGPLRGRRLLEFTRLRISDVGRVRAAHGGTLNDVVLCAIAGGLHRYLEAIGIRTAGLGPTALVPVSLRSARERETLGNRLGALLVPLAVGAENEATRLRETCAITERLKTSTCWHDLEALLDLIEEIPPRIWERLVRALPLGRVASLLATNVPGPRETRYLRGRRVEALYPVAPLADGVGLGIAVFSYDGWLHVGLNADADLMPDLEKLRLAIEEAFAALQGSS